MSAQTFSRRRAAFVMLEAVLALALFATVATAMAVALNQLSSASTDMRREALLLRYLESAMVETTGRQPLVAGQVETAVDAFGVRVQTRVQPVDLKGESGRQLEGLYEVSIVASLEDGGSEPAMERSLKQVVFADPAEGSAR